MDTPTIAILAVVALVVLAGVVLLAAARRNQTQKAIGVLSRETRSRDAGAHEGHDGEDGDGGRVHGVVPFVPSSYSSKKRPAFQGNTKLKPGPRKNEPMMTSTAQNIRKIVKRETTNLRSVGLLDGLRSV